MPWQNTTTNVAYKRNHLIWVLWSERIKVRNSMVRTMAVGRQTGMAERLILIHKLDLDREREIYFGLLYAFKTSKHAPSDIPLPTWTDLSILPNSSMKWGIKHSRAWIYQSYFLSNHQKLVCVQSWEESLLGLNLVTFSCFLIYIPLLWNRIWMERNLEKIDIVLHMEESEYTDKNHM